MLLRFSVENWMSFRDEVTLDLVATREEQHSNHIAMIEKYGLKLLPIAVIYGANASGKSNLIKALAFAQKLVTDPPKADAPIPVKPFRLKKESSELPTRFRFEVLIDESIYEYSFSVTRNKVAHEELKQINKASEEILFRRLEGKLDPQDQFPANSALRFAFEGTQDNQLYLSNSVSQKLMDFRVVYDWFKLKLILILPVWLDTKSPRIPSDNHPLFNKMTARLRELDSGISALHHAELSLETVIAKEFVDGLTSHLREGEWLSLAHPFFEDELFDNNNDVFLYRENGKVVARRLEPIHKTESGEDIPFRLADESDGTRRLIGLLQQLLWLEEQYPLTLVIDELDRSLHSNLTRNLLEHYLAQETTSSRSQLIFTTHDTQLMTQELFRRDEIWITERDESGASKLVAFSEFKDVRSDKDIRKSYLQGRMGGVPRIRTSSVSCDDGATVR